VLEMVGKNRMKIKNISRRHGRCTEEQPGGTSDD
jgi:hypothetical protein